MKLLGLLQGGRGRNARELAAVCGVSRRTIFRDLELLREAGVPLAYDEERQTYAVQGQYFLPPTAFTQDEALALILLCHELGGASNLPFCTAAQAAAAKLENHLPERLIAYLRTVSHAIRIKLDVTNPLHGSVGHYERLVEAVSKRLSVRIEYESFTESDVIQTKLHPYNLLFNQHSWYVIGRSSIHREARTFNLARIRTLEVVNEPYEMPFHFSLDRYLGNAWRMISDGPDVEVRLRFQPKVARNVAEVQWHKTQRVDLRPDGAVDFHVTVAGIQEISWWIMGYGDQVEVLAPDELRTLIGERAERTAALYRGGSCA